MDLGFDVSGKLVTIKSAATLNQYEMAELVRRYYDIDITTIIEQLLLCSYQCEGGPLRSNVAFVELQKLTPSA